MQSISKRNLSLNEKIRVLHKCALKKTNSNKECVRHYYPLRKNKTKQNSKGVAE